MIMAPTLAKTAAPPTTQGVPARGNGAIASIGVTSPREQIASPDLQREVTIHNAAEMDDARSLTILWRITLGILIFAVTGAIATLIISS